jgi:hypothetical protein
MTRYYRRKKTGAGEDIRAGLVAGALATMVAGVSFYLVRIFLSREALEPLEGEASPDRPQETTMEDEG